MRRLLLVLGLLATVGCGAADPPSTSTPTRGGTVDPQAPTTAAEARSVIDKVAGGVVSPVDVSTFVTPSGIYCNLTDSNGAPLGCEPAKPTVEDTTYCAGAPTKRIGRIELDAGVPKPVCNADTIRSVDGASLPYGQATTAAGHAMKCVNQEIGVTCLATGGSRGFFLGTGGFLLLS
ncbi:MAG: hypothetical protein JWO46_2742 [Nocardioidaceae bacterium]|nr:hypothetical protein [Nocardioidaceae bacterium]